MTLFMQLSMRDFGRRCALLGVFKTQGPQEMTPHT